MTLPKKFPKSEFFWSVFSPIWTKYGDYVYKMLENVDQKYSEQVHFSRSVFIFTGSTKLHLYTEYGIRYWSVQN